MALTFSNIGTATSTTSSATLVQTAVNIAAGSWALVCVAADNAGTNGAASLSDTMTDSEGNTYDLISKTTQDPGAANAGTTLGIWLAKIDNALSNGSITANFSPNTIAKAMTVKLITVGAGETLGIHAIGPGFTGSGTAYSSGTVSVPNGYTIFGATALEQNTAAAADTDTTNGSWSTAYTAEASTGTATTSQSITSQQKTVTATANQTYNTSSGSTRDWALNYVVFYPELLPAGFIGYWAVNGVTTK
jgi:hypothetical protein